MIALGENAAYAAEVPFFWPLASDPINLGLTGHDFTNNAISGEVKVKLPGGAWFNVAGAQIVEKGFGWYCVQLTAAQCTTAGVVYVSATTSLAQPFYGFEEIGILGGDIPIDGDGDYSFFLPNASDPIFGAPISGHAFLATEIKVCLPGLAFANADPGSVTEIGGGTYALSLNGAATATRGKVFVYVSAVGSQPSSGFVSVLNPGAITLPDSASASGVAASDINNQIAKFYGEDIWYDVAAADPATGAADYVVAAHGDWALATGIEALRQSLLRRLITNPGELQTAPEYGVGAQSFVKRPNTPAVIAELEARIRSQFLRDDRVESVSTVDVQPLDDGDGIVITVFVVAAGRLRQDAPIPVQIAIQ